MSILDSALDMVRRDINYEAEEPNKDIWRTYAESIKNGGDCEDMCLAMYQTLLAKGVLDEDMSLVGGKITTFRNRGEDHMVLEVYFDKGLAILDPRLSRPVNGEKYYRKYLQDHSSLSDEGLFVGGIKWFERGLDPRWQRYQAQLKKERG